MDPGHGKKPGVVFRSRSDGLAASTYQTYTLAYRTIRSAGFAGYSSLGWISAVTKKFSCRFVGHAIFNSSLNCRLLSPAELHMLTDFTLSNHNYQLLFTFPAKIYCDLWICWSFTHGRRSLRSRNMDRYTMVAGESLTKIPVLIRLHCGRLFFTYNSTKLRFFFSGLHDSNFLLFFVTNWYLL